MTFESPEEFIMNSSIGIHMVSANGIIEYANLRELEMLGYDREEYVGHHISEFQMDGRVVEDMVERLAKYEELKNYPSMVRGKSEIKYVLYNSSVYVQNGEFVHTRCYGSDIDKTVYEHFLRVSPYFASS